MEIIPKFARLPLRQKLQTRFGGFVARVNFQGFFELVPRLFLKPLLRQVQSSNAGIDSDSAWLLWVFFKQSCGFILIRPMRDALVEAAKMFSDKNFG